MRRDGVGAGAIGDDIIGSWVDRELAPWRGLGFDQTKAEEMLRAAVATHPKMCLFRIERGRASVDLELAAERPYFLDRAHPMGERALGYIDHLNDACSIYGVTGTTVIAIWLDDIFPDGFAAPIFCFQKRRGSGGILLPDIDFMNWRHYSDESDQLVDLTSFASKRDEAIFVGSTTGDVVLTSAHVAELTNARLRAAARFRDNERVTFHLPHVVQCDSPETEQLVRQLGFSGRFWTWPEQFGFRYLLSLDGNGATCSRVALALSSNSVLFKYESPYELYYFQGLEPWRHYVPISADEDVEHILGDSQLLEPAFMQIVAASQLFARTFLTRLSVLRYTAELVSGYANLLAAERIPLRYRGQAELIDLFGHVAWRGSRWAAPGDWLNAGTGSSDAGHSIEGIRLTSAVEIPPHDVAYSVRVGTGWSEWVNAGFFAGSIGQSQPLFGVVIELRGESARRFEIRYQARFADGFETRVCASGTKIERQSPLIDLRIEMVKKPRSWIDRWIRSVLGRKL
jgi:hypothetical protein